ncbi:RCC1 BLIP-II [Pyrrhoderma noxium]|uniref:RCC1 BLIP-II n=1 Tax=Pyrrhoderma noxium TaxID=2282107 RepID=A0A286UTB1_9AGAM|nr:RCC1 BLIP-II [Pyrrhoderma noxium]
MGGACAWAINRKGELFIWGTVLGDDHLLRADSKIMFRNAMRLEMGTRISSIASDVTYSIAIDMERNVWIIIRPDRPYIIESDLINNEHADSTPIQVVCGRFFSAILTRSGEVYFIWPFDAYAMGAFRKQYEGSSTRFEIEGNSISCKTWKLKYDLYKLPQIGDLPELNQRDRIPGSNSPPKITKIAAMYNRLFGITDDGHILSITGVESRAEIRDKHWTYFKEGGIPKKGWETHVAARGLRYSVVRSTADPRAVPDLEDPVYRLHFTSSNSGYNHVIHLSSCGKVFTDGYNNDHALGRGDLKEYEWHGVGEVDFGKGKFCISVTAGRSQSGALVADLNPIPDLNPVTD